MIIEPTGARSFTTDLSGYPTVGFHATSTTASTDIEREGFLPKKIFATTVHNQLLALAKQLNIDTDKLGGYEQWLAMRSITFAKDFSAAMTHVNLGRFRAQGLQHIFHILNEAGNLTNPPPIVAQIQTDILQIQNSTPIIYAVDLSNLGARLTEPEYENYYQIFFNPAGPTPTTSIIGPERLIARLNL